MFCVGKAIIYPTIVIFGVVGHYCVVAEVLLCRTPIRNIYTLAFYIGGKFSFLRNLLICFVLFELIPFVMFTIMIGHWKNVTVQLNKYANWIFQNGWCTENSVETLNNAINFTLKQRKFVILLCIWKRKCFELKLCKQMSRIREKLSSTSARRM